MFEAMIPYDDLVAALQQWRARQGLPVNTLGQSGSGGTPAPGSGPHGRPGSGPHGASSSRPGMPAMATAVDEEALDVDSAAVLEDDAYEASNDYSGGRQGVQTEPVERATENDMRRGGRGHEDW